MTTVSFKRAMDGASAYQRWQFATLSANTPEPVAEAEEPMITAGELARIKAAAHADGYAAGFASGRGDAAHAVAAEAEHLRNIAGALDRARVVLSDETAVALLTLAFDIAGHVLRSELALNREAMLPAVREAIDLAGSGAHPQLLLNPGDIDFVRRHLAEELVREHWRLTEDPRIEPGGCRVLTADGAVDATLSARWRRAAGSLGLDAPPETEIRPAAIPAAGD